MPRNISFSFTVPLKIEAWDRVRDASSLPSEINIDESVQIPYILLTTSTTNGTKSELVMDESCISNAYRTSFVNINESSKRATRFYAIDKVIVNVTMSNVSDEICAVLSCDKSPDRKQAEKANDFGDEVAGHAISAVNVFLAYVRTKKLQYWVDPLQTSWAACNWILEQEGNTKYFIEGDKPRSWKHWGNTLKAVVTQYSNNNSESLTDEDVKALQNINIETFRTDAAREFLVNAHRLVHLDHLRGAVLEGTAALEVSFNKFIKNYNPKHLLNGAFTRGLSMQTLGADLKRFGFSRSVKYFIPCLFDNETLDGKVIEDCCSLIELRQNVSHNATRNLNSGRVRGYLIQAEIMCDVLDNACSESK